MVKAGSRLVAGGQPAGRCGMCTLRKTRLPGLLRPVAYRSSRRQPPTGGLRHASEFPRKRATPPAAPSLHALPRPPGRAGRRSHDCQNPACKRTPGGRLDEPSCPTEPLARSLGRVPPRTVAGRDRWWPDASCRFVSCLCFSRLAGAQTQTFGPPTRGAWPAAVPRGSWRSIRGLGCRAGSEVSCRHSAGASLQAGGRRHEAGVP